MHNIFKNRNLISRAVVALFIVVACLSFPALLSAQQGGTTRYVYDDAGRLRAVITPTGEAVVYEYDAAGNPTAIRRVTMDTLEILAFAPGEGSVGDRVTLFGTGFAAVTAVSFNGTAARIIESTASTIITEVPEGATTGTITVTTANMTATSPRIFTVRPKVDVTPKRTRLVPGENLQYNAFVSQSLGDTRVTWSVNGIVGGNAEVGTITNEGTYVAPSRFNQTFTIRATSVVMPELFGEATVTIRNPDDITEARAPSVTVRRGLEKGAVFTAGAYGAGMSVFRPPINPTTVSAFGNGVSVERPTGIVTIVGSFGAGVVVQRGLPVGTNAVGALVTVTKSPTIRSVSPTTLPRGTSTNVTITGGNFAGASSFRFIREDGSVDAGITVTNVVVDAEGRTLTATVTVGASATIGTRVVFITATAGSSQKENTGLNVIEIVP